MKNKIRQLTLIVLAGLALGLSAAAQETRSGQVIGSGYFTAVSSSTGEDEQENPAPGGGSANNGGMIGSGTAVDNGGFMGSGGRTGSFTDGFYGYFQDWIKEIF